MLRDSIQHHLVAKMTIQVDDSDDDGGDDCDSVNDDCLQRFWLSHQPFISGSITNAVMKMLRIVDLRFEALAKCEAAISSLFIDLHY